MNLLNDDNNILWQSKCCIYCYTNKINNKKYIGQVNRNNKNLKQRHIQHINSCKNKKSKDYNSPFHRAIRKYGINNFTLKIIHIADKYSVDLLEKHYIYFYDTLVCSNGYNISNGGANGNPFAGKTKEEKKEINKKIGEKAKQRLQNKENHPMYSKHHSEKTKEKISKTWNDKSENNKNNIKNKISNNHADMKGENNPMHGKHHSEKTKEKISQINKGKKRTKEQKENLSKSHKGKPRGELVAKINKDTFEIMEIAYNFEYINQGFSSSHVTSCCKGKLKTHKGFIFKYFIDCSDKQINQYIIKNKQINF